ncbi:Uncharacterised protein [Bordetella bronchiseptica]|nr:Uncharacterised protein [Bordetella bronchiseptica]
MPHDDSPIGSADAAHRLDIGHLLDRQRIAAHQAGKGRHAEHRHRDNDVDHARPQDRHHADGQQHARERQQHVGNAHGDAFPPALVVARHQAHERADHGAHGHRQEAGGQRNSRAHDDAAEDVAAQRVHAQPVSGRRPGVQGVVVEEILRIERHDPGREDGDERQQQDEQAGADGQLLLLELAPELGGGRAHVLLGGLRGHGGGIGVAHGRLTCSGCWD